MPSSSAAARNYRIGSQRLTSARARSERTGVTPLPPGGASAGAFGAKLATLALDYYANRGKVSAEEIKAQSDAEYRDLQTEKLRRDLATPEAATYEVGGIPGLKPYEAFRATQDLKPKVATPEVLVSAEERAALGVPPDINTRPGVNAYLIDQRAKQRTSEVSRWNSESVRATRELAALKDEEAKYANLMLTRTGDRWLSQHEQDAQSPDLARRTKALQELGMPPEYADPVKLSNGTTRKKVLEQIARLRVQFADTYRARAGEKFAGQRAELRRRLAGLRANMPMLDEGAAPEAVEAIDPRAMDY